MATKFDGNLIHQNASRFEKMTNYKPFAVSGKFTLMDINLTIGVMNVKLNPPSNFPAMRYISTHEINSTIDFYKLCQTLLPPHNK